MKRINVYKVQTPMSRIEHRRGDGCWIVYLTHDPLFKYGTWLVLYDNGKRELQIVRPDEVDVRELE